jgi:hypothetical protein
MSENFVLTVSPQPTGKNRIFHPALGTLGGGWTKIVLRGDLRVLSGVPGGFRHSGVGCVLVSEWSVTAQTFVEIVSNIFPPFFFLLYESGKWRRTRRGNGIRRHPVSLARRVCHGRNNSVPPTETSNTTPQEMVYRECVCMGDSMGIFFQRCRGDTCAEWRRWSHYSRCAQRNITVTSG